jgi:hypothetical protein
VRRFKSSQQLGLAAPLARLTIAAEAEVRDQLAACAADIRSVTRAQSLAFADTPADGFEQLGPGLWLAIER